MGSQGALLCAGFLRARARRRRTAPRAVVEDGPHADALREWLQRCVVGLNFCPWAGPAADAGHVRVAVSTATDEPGVLADLRAEARRLPEGAEVPAGAATTTLLACPDVAEWSSYVAFDAFYRERLANGYALAAAGLYVVPFHPRFGDYSLGVGDVVEMGEGEGGARVLDAQAGFGERGERLARVLPLAGGEEQLICLPPEPGPEAVASRAPRPVLHLLRTEDLERADADPGLRERNWRTARDLGKEGAEQLLRCCG